MKKTLSLLFLITILFSCRATNPVQKKTISNQNHDYWQQHVDYTMNVDMDVKTYQYSGTQHLVYTNNSPDVLNRVYYHLFYNAFQPGSEMDIRSLTIADPDSRVGDRISKLALEDQGFLKVETLTQNGVALHYETVGTVLEVDLATPIQPGEQVTFEMVFKGQVPLQIRRAGKNNKEGVALSMAQWYPKLAEYDFEGWHADPYIAREFHGVWGNFDVTINIDKNYTIGGTGYLQNPQDIGHGYTLEKVKNTKADKLSWHFVAPNVHDFTWAADPNYHHDTMQVPNGPLLHFFYKNTMPKDKLENWKNVQSKTVELMQYYSEHVGQYPYEQYSVIQGGDGGMEYGMCTLIVGEGSFNGLFGVIAHEMAHTWFQFLLASNESKHEWMDEGFTSYISDLAENEILQKNLENPTKNAFRGYIYLATSGKEQPLTTHADRYVYNQAYSISAYSKGEVFLAQLGYIMGEDLLKQTIKKYFKDFAFKHPTPNDIIRTAEKVSGLELDWYLMDFGQTTNTIDYAVKAVEGNTVTLERMGLMPMPIDLTITYTDGSTEDFYIPLQMMRGEKPTTATIIADWAWAYPTYTFTALKPVAKVQIDPKEGMVDINKNNNSK
ncbi:MAG: M1 family metallopeptidase [Flavobacteriales bacterium]|nr:M1 family metallopeptidase [Flavobacteriales bacterium]PIY10534.1 MAG: peptidase M1 [Flavobacteriaceae bacterium CG_4_10_14_3_um_filter_33_47]PJB16465.1 MAG: peptidase M1 [Flavobacteriaceae bacterium CG_4_9_14_3_um_filter_33_16]